MSLCCTLVHRTVHRNLGCDYHEHKKGRKGLIFKLRNPESCCCANFLYKIKQQSLLWLPWIAGWWVVGNKSLVMWQLDDDGGLLHCKMGVGEPWSPSCSNFDTICDNDKGDDYNQQAGVAKDFREELTGRNLLARTRPNFLTLSYSNIQICPAEKLWPGK